ncbi:hyalin [Lingula anatina]|uniref:Hyalin n=1 Tax=Lingula anatina TaxID=7574 RepID=A0A1S3IWC9_LINAN|nr:hyalin [Lingula anatina]|eukprot:XP_013402495.1 hyalin [Lingula anatina]
MHAGRLLNVLILAAFAVLETCGYTEILCQPLQKPQNGVFSVRQCMSQPSVRMICAVICYPGYVVQGQASVVCKNDGTWSGTPGYCRDNQSPIIRHETSNIIVNAALDSNQAVVNWEQDKPRVIDNSRKVPSVRLYIGGREIKGGGYEHTFKIGLTTVKYVFTDDSGNSADFFFRVEVRDVQPPTITCPKVDPVVSPDREVDVSWVQPTVTDNSGKPVRVISNMSPGKLYRGRYKVVYEARDEAGNRASCSFTLHVRPPKCPDLHTPINGAVSCDTFGFGMFCTLQCQNPYDFDLPAGMTSVPNYYACGGGGRWFPSTQVPDCTRYQNPNGSFVRTLYYDNECPDPRAQKQIKENGVSSFKMSPFGSSCNCGLTVDDFRVICGATNTSAVRAPDNQSPIISHQTSDITVNAALDSNQAVVNWEQDKPRVTDNSGKVPSVRLYISGREIKGGGYEHTFKIGVTTVKYVFTDDSGNSADFIFRVDVRDVQPPTITCPKVDPVVSTNREVDVSWVQPTVTDNSGKPVTVISNFSPGKFYWGRYKVVYDARDEAGNRASCSFTLNVEPPKCPDLHTPINGALSCDTFGFGMFCTLQCQNPYDFDLPTGMTSVPNYYVCGGGGRWAPTTQVPDCTRYQNRNEYLVRTLYYDYKCPDPRAQKQIKENTVSIFQETPFGWLCNCNVTVENFRVICGATNTSAVRGTPGSK